METINITAITTDKTTVDAVPPDEDEVNGDVVAVSDVWSECVCSVQCVSSVSGSGSGSVHPVGTVSVAIYVFFKKEILIFKKKENNKIIRDKTKNMTQKLQISI